MGQTLSPAAKERVAAAKRGKSTELVLSNSELRGFPRALLKLSPFLHHLDLSKNYLSEIPKEVIKFADLEGLNVGFNNIGRIAEELAALPHFTALNVEGNSTLSALPDLRNLTSLNVGGTLIASGSASGSGASGDPFTRFPRLVELSAASANLTSLPPSVLVLGSLRVLRLGSNKLTALPPAISALTALEVLDLTANPIAYLPPEVGTLVKLTHLLLAQTQVATLPAELYRLRCLVVLDVSQCPSLDSIDIDFTAMSSLKELRASSGHLRSLGPSSARSMPSLASLELLDLSRNRLVALPNEVGLLPAIRKIEAQQNEIAELPGELSFLARTVELNLSGNPLKQPFSAWLQEGVHSLLDNLLPYCSSWAPNCTVEPAVVNVASRTPVEFKVIARDFKGNPRITGKDPFKMVVRSLATAAAEVVDSFLRDGADMPGQDRKPGVYNCFFNLPAPGPYEVAITLDGVGIKGSPFVVTAT